MEKIKYIILVSLLCWIGQGCSQFLDVDIPDVLPDKDFWKNRSQVEAARNGVYTQLGNCVKTFMVWGDIRSDLYTSGSALNASNTQLINQDILTSNSYADWKVVYKTINFANSFIENARRVVA
ncbi:MAG: hypothetical protein RR397_10790, partial [Odoribacter sp.]